MKKLVVFIMILVLVVSCKENKEKNQEKVKDKTAYASFGKKITDDKVLSKELVEEKFKALQEGDTVNLKFASTVNEVCKKKGCWMKLDLGNDKESMVRFKDYDFFVPMDVDNKEVIVNGKAFVTKISVDQLKHYAKDGGKSEEEIAAITEPEYTYAFEADGVLIKK